VERERDCEFLLSIVLPRTVVDPYPICTQLIGTKQGIGHLVAKIKRLINHQYVSFACRRTIIGGCHGSDGHIHHRLILIREGRDRYDLASKIRYNCVFPSNACIGMCVEFNTTF